MKLRFGKKIDLPSTASVKHELRLMAAIDDLVDGGILETAARSNDAERQILSADIARKHGISLGRAGMLVDRFSENRHTLDVAAKALAAREPTAGGAR